MTGISIIVPCLNEQKALPGFLDHLSAVARHCEIVLVDGGSTDASVEIAKSYPHINVIELASAQRALQMNAGAMHATGDVYLFLHADTFLPEDFGHLVHQALAHPDTVGGSFYLVFDHPHWLLRLTTWVTRRNLSFLTVGDHGLFFRREIFEELGGYPGIPILEDLELQKRARKLGVMAKVNAPVRTSARRFVNNGVVRQALHDGWILLRYFMGTSPIKLAREYSNKSEIAR